MSEIVLIRPGCTDFDEQKRIQGTLDLPLNPHGQEQVQQLVEQLHDIPLEAIYTSNSQPAKSTAEAIGDSLSIPVKSKDGLCNLNQGLWQGLQIDEVKRKYPKVYKQWQESPETICPPEGETITEALSRVEKVLQKPLKRHELFGIVASEPLATLIVCLIENRKAEVPDSFCRSDQSRSIEILQVSNGEAVETSDLKSNDSAEQTEPSVPAVTSKSSRTNSPDSGKNT